MANLPTRTLRNYLASLPSGGNAGVLDQQLMIRTDFATLNRALPSGGNPGEVLAKQGSGDYDVAWTIAGNGDMQASTYDPQNIAADAFARANHTGTQPHTTITGLGTAATANVGDFLQPNAVQTATNKRIVPRVASSATETAINPDADALDLIAISAQAGALTIGAPSGTPTDGQRLMVRIRDDGTSRALTWNAAYTAFNPGDLPSATIVGMTLIFDFVWNDDLSKWELLASNRMQGLWA